METHHRILRKQSILLFGILCILLPATLFLQTDLTNLRAEIVSDYGDVAVESSTANAAGADEYVDDTNGNTTHTIKEESCFEARTNTTPTHLYGKLPTPYINLGFAKMGSSSIHAFFGCAGYRSTHYRCLPGSSCAKCIRQSIEDGLPPLQHCGSADVFAQIDDGSKGHYPQVEYIDELATGHPNATFLLPFRSMEKWYKSMKGWHQMNIKLRRANITGLPIGTGKNVDEFSTWWCWHVKRVRDIVARNPSHALVEINLEDPSTRERMGEMFGVDESCWGKANANSNIHPELNGTADSVEKKRWRLNGS